MINEKLAIASNTVKNNLRTFISLNVQSAECLDVHYFAVLIGVGATSVNAYMAQQAIADRHKKGLFKSPNEKIIEKCVIIKNY